MPFPLLLQNNPLLAIIRRGGAVAERKGGICQCLWSSLQCTPPLGDALWTERNHMLSDFFASLPLLSLSQYPSSLQRTNLSDGRALFSIDLFIDVLSAKSC